MLTVLLDFKLSLCSYILGAFFFVVRKMEKLCFLLKYCNKIVGKLLHESYYTLHRCFFCSIKVFKFLSIFILVGQVV